MLQYDRSLQVRGQFRLSGRPGQVDAESVGDAFAIGRVGLQAVGDMPDFDLFRGIPMLPERLAATRR